MRCKILFLLVIVALVGCAAPQAAPDPAVTSAPASAPQGESGPHGEGPHGAHPHGEAPVEVVLAERPEGSLEGEAAITEEALGRHAGWLADDARQGRGVGTPGLEESAEYLAARFREAGLAPAGDEGGYFQSFEVTVGATLTADKDQALKLGDRALKLQEAWRPLSFSESGQVKGALVFAGYGISAPELGYDDYEGLDVKGRVVVVLRHEPGRRDPGSKFDGVEPSRHSELRYKAHVAQRHGAAALLVLNDPVSYTSPTKEDPDELYTFGGSAQAGLLAVHLTWKGGGARLQELLGLDLGELQGRIDATGKPASVATVREAEVKVQIERKSARVRNVVAVARPAGEGAEDGAVVVGAHYDHLGFGDESSLKPGSKEVHNGADDNASGTALLLELAQALGSRPEALRRPVYFVAFTAEEIGIRGSEYFVNHAPVPTQKIAAMVNFDMVGRLREQRLMVGGVGTAREFEALVQGASQGGGLEITTSRDGYGPSDHAPFYARKVPVLFLFTGAHEQYHTPEDDVGLLNLPGLAQVGVFAYRLVHYLATAPERPLYTRADARPEGDQGGTGRRGYGAWLGSVPSFAETDGQGVLLQGVTAGSPAEAAGIKPEDRIVGFAGSPVKDLYDLTYALREHKPGDKVKVTVQRGQERVELEVTLGKRP
jgi:aminopeptidase YwaD